jgi:glutathione peroxidase
MSIYDFEVKDIDGEVIKIDQYKGKVLIIVNTASKCGFTPQYNDLEKIYEKYKDQGLEILGFPCNQFADQEPGNNKEVKNFCTLNYGVTFPIFEKVDVRGKDADPIFKYLTLKAPYKGIDQSNMSGKILHKFLSEELPEYLVGDSIKWNFTKFLIDRNGNVVERFESPVEPMDMVKDIEALF